MQAKNYVVVCGAYWHQTQGILHQVVRYCATEHQALRIADKLRKGWEDVSVHCCI